MPTVLIIEDYEPLRILYDKFLGHAGYTVIQTAELKEAFEYLRISTPDIVLLDLSLADGTSLPVVNYLKQSPRFEATQLVAITGNDQFQSLAGEYGIEYFLYKPVSMPMLITFLERIMARSRCAVA